jgi:hypothetical protein
MLVALGILVIVVAGVVYEYKTVPLLLVIELIAAPTHKPAELETGTEVVVEVEVVGTRDRPSTLSNKKDDESNNKQQR